MAHGRGDSRGYIFVMADRPEDPAAGRPFHPSGFGLLAEAGLL